MKDSEDFGKIIQFPVKQICEYNCTYDEDYNEDESLADLLNTIIYCVKQIAEKTNLTI